MTNGTISEKCETLYNKLNTFVTSVINRDVTPKISNLNTEVWGSDTQTGNSRIDTLNTNFNNLDSSITSMESDINNVESDVSNLQTSVNSLNTSIANYTTYLDNANYTVKYNDYRVLIDIHMSSTTFPVTLSNFGADVIPADCLPSQPVAVPMQNVDAIVSIRDNSQGVWRKSNTGSAIQGVSCYCHIEYSRV